MTPEGLSTGDRDQVEEVREPPGPPDPPGPLLRLVRDQRVAYLIVGGLNTLISFAAFAVFSHLTHLWGGDLAVLGAQLIAIPIGFALHRRFVFRVTGHLLRDLGRFVLVTVLPITVNLAVLPVLSTVFRWPVLLSQVGFTLMWVVSSYFLHRGFSFRRTALERADPGSG